MNFLKNVSIIVGLLIITLLGLNAHPVDAANLKKYIQPVALVKANCGVASLAYFLEKEGYFPEAEKVKKILPSSWKGHSIKDLKEIANEHGYSLDALRLTQSDEA